ncbi:alpha/beta hydrolase [Nocardia salmonicida]|uniref:alpha/beta hydrolase n=1 Tax=Nocardia salmonicida TaxID=53431 RepID=UPI0037B46FE9
MTTEITFLSHGTQCAAWHLPARANALAGSAGRPAVVMAHGFGGTRDTGLLGYAEAFADAGIDTLLFDYRGFGASEGTPRQNVSYRRQRQDYHAAIATARRLPGVDPDRIIVWGTSYSGGHVLAVAAQDRRIAAVVSMTPATDGLVTLAHVARRGGIGHLARVISHLGLDLVRALARRTPHHVPVLGLPGSAAMIITTAEAIDTITSIAGPTWRNEVCARTALEIGLNRPTTFAGRVSCPILFQIGGNDTVAPPAAARRSAQKVESRAQVLEYPLDHFDVYDGPWQKQALGDQLRFLSEILAPEQTPDHERPSPAIG